jgi:hypothetical protein
MIYIWDFMHHPESQAKIDGFVDANIVGLSQQQIDAFLQSGLISSMINTIQHFLLKVCSNDLTGIAD